ncbi:MAG: MFS transporter [Candidatus Omnitrophica bacterium]|nr:MFS transporter [Candidatus Omnitrophota bacterium]
MQTSPPHSFLKQFSWALYDFANTIFSAVVVTVYFPLYATDILGANTPVGISATASMIAAGLMIPALGLLIDRTGKAKRYLIFTTLLCVGATAALFFQKNPAPLLFFFFAANLTYHMALVFYNALLPCVAEPKTQGFVSGLGVGLGYLGVVCALPIADWCDREYGRPAVFLLAAGMFLFFSFPVFARVPERQKAPDSHAPRVFLKQALHDLWQDKNALRFLAGNFCLVDAMNAAILWLSVFLTRLFAVPSQTLVQTIIWINLSAGLWAFVLGKVTDRAGAKKVLMGSAAAMAAALLILSTSGSFETAFWALVIFGSGAIAGTWTAGRKLLIDLAPLNRQGEYFGFYGLTNKISAVGSLLVAVLADLFGFRIAVFTLLLPVAAALFLIGSVNTAGE